MHERLASDLGQAGANFSTAASPENLPVQRLRSRRPQRKRHSPGEAPRPAQRVGLPRPLRPHNWLWFIGRMLNRPRDRFILLTVLALILLAGEIAAVRWL